MNRLRRISKFFSTTLIVLMLSVIFFSPSANALSVSEPTLFGGTFSRQGEVDAIHQLVTKKSEVFEVEAKAITAISEKKLSLAEEVEQLKEQVASLDDMFVRINKYAPDSAGNRYVPGNCTWYVKSKRPDIGNFWGNANTWYSNAKAQGWNVGQKAKKGAVGTTQSGFYGHVVYVESVSLDGNWVTVSEMNYGALYKMNTRTVHSSTFSYIYELD